MSSPYVDEGMHNCQIYADPVPDIREVPQSSHVEDEMYIEGDNWHCNGSHFPVVQGGYSAENDNSDIPFINGCPPYTTWGVENGFFSGSSDGAESSSGKTKAVWCKIRAALKWVISVRRDAATKRNANLFYFNY